MSKQEPNESLHSETNIFDPVVYIKAHYSEPENSPCQQDYEIVEWTSGKIHGLFVGGKYRGKTLLGIGTGPVVKDVITASEWFDEIILTDISKDNVAFLHKWMAGDSEATASMRYQITDFAIREGKGTPWEAKSEQVRKKVKYAMVWDMNKPEMLKGTLLDDVRVDSVISCLNMCTTSSTIAGYMAVVKTISDILKPGGHFVALDVMDQSTYTVGDKTFSLLCVTPEEIKESFLQNEFEIEQFETHDLGNCPKTVRSDAKTVYCVVGRKR